MRILIADDEYLVRASLISMLDELNLPSYSLQEATTGEQLVDVVRHDLPDIAFVDIRMPGLNGLEVLSRVKACRPEQCVVMLSMHASAKHIRGALNAGAMGYLTKETAPDELVDAIRAVFSGQRYLGDDLERLL